jgi:hypothetical protein
MLEALLILVDEDLDDPLYADPSPKDMDDEARELLMLAFQEAEDGEGEADGVKHLGEVRVGWKVLTRHGLAFGVVVTDDVPTQQVERYLNHLARRYMDEVDDPRRPDREGIEDIVIDVIPPWEEEED